MAVQKNQATNKALELIQSLNEKNPYYTLGLFLLTLFLLDYFLLMQFQLRVLYAINPKAAAISQEVHLTQEDIAKVPQYQKDIKVLAERVKSLNSKIRTRDELSLIIDDVTRLARANGVRIEDILPNASVSQPLLKDNDGQYFAIPFLITARAGYHQFGRFLNQIERSENFLTIGDFSLETSPTDATHEVIKMILNAIVFEPKGSST